MGYSNGYITAPVVSDDVAMVLGSASQDWGQLCTHQNINKWSSRKPIRSDSIEELQETRMVGRGNMPYGLDIPYLSSSSKPQDLVSDDNSFAEWKYYKPEEGVDSFRILDFENYEHYIADLFKVEWVGRDKETGDVIVKLRINQISCKNDAELNSSGGNVGDMISRGHLTPRNFYITQNIRLSNYYVGIMLWDVSTEKWIFIITEISPIGSRDYIEITIPQDVTYYLDGSYIIVPCLSQEKVEDGELEEEINFSNCIAIEMQRIASAYISEGIVGELLIKNNTHKYYNRTLSPQVGYNRVVTYTPNESAPIRLFDNMPLRTMIISGELVEYKPTTYTSELEYKIPIATLNTKNVIGDMLIYLTIKNQGGQWLFGLYGFESSAETESGEYYIDTNISFKSIKKIVINNNVRGSQASGCNVTIHYIDERNIENEITHEDILAFISHNSSGTESSIKIGAYNDNVTTNLPTNFLEYYNLTMYISLDEIYSS